MSFEDELIRVLPEDLPHREELIRLGARHLSTIEETNQVMNLTRITDPAEAAIKHICDSVLPWRHFETAATVLDVGTGPGFPGLPLAIVLPRVRFVLAESIQKKAKFVESVIRDLSLSNVQVRGVRAEEILRSSSFDILTARALTPIVKIVPLLARAFTTGSELLLYKGPDVETEIADATEQLRRHKVDVEIAGRYDLPDNAGYRTLVRLRRSAGS